MAETYTKEELVKQIEGKLARYYGLAPNEATKEHIFKAVAVTIRDILRQKRTAFSNKAKSMEAKRVYYLCMEFLVGTSMRNNIYNLGIEKVMEEILAEYGMELSELYAMDPDPGLGNGGLGRLAACFMDALATQNYPAMGYSIRYEYGLFKQKIVDGWQMEMPDVWLPNGESWLVPRQDESVIIHFDGEIEERWEDGRLKIYHYNCEEVEAVPYDMMISGKNSEAVSALRLWRAVNPENFDMKLFSQGEYARAMEKTANIEAISKVLYPADDNHEGKSLRLRQQYFMVSAALQDIIKRHFRKYSSLDNLHEKAAIHINDTHPVLAIPELMRILMDDYGYDWDKAWYIVTNTMAYTNHTVMAEALETWQADLIQRRLPRIYMIIKEINERFCRVVWEKYPGDWGLAEKLAVISQNTVRMANLAIIGGHSVNGVAKIHSEILKYKIFNEFYTLEPKKFINITNGIAHRRWLCQSNPNLSRLITECIGDGFVKDASRLKSLEKFADDTGVLNQLDVIKMHNKRIFADYTLKNLDVSLDPSTVFNVQAKRLHEYKRQLLNALRIIGQYLILLDNPEADILPQTYIFAAKAAPSYYMAKRIISLIWNLGKEIEKNSKISEKLKVAFLDNYSVSLAEVMMPATEISQQISLAGKEASGTGNMKMMINGAVTLGTMDGANVEIFNEVKNDNIFIFGMSDHEVDSLWQQGYKSESYYQQNEHLRRVVNRLITGFNGNSFKDIYDYLITGGIADPYMCLADFGDYCRVHELADSAYKDRKRWNRMSLVNIANAGVFAADRSIKEYADKIWNVKPLS